jgi:hypothetical protein
LSWGRKIYKSQVYTSDTRYSLHGFTSKVATIKGIPFNLKLRNKNV